MSKTPLTDGYRAGMQEAYDRGRIHSGIESLLLKMGDLERQLAEAREQLNDWKNAGTKIAIKLVAAGCVSDGIVDGVGELVEQRGRLVEELETERIRLAACGVVALADTTESAARAREMLPKYHSASLGDVIRRVDECMVLREQRDRLAEALKDATDNCLWRSDSEFPLSKEESQRIFDKAMSALAAVKGGRE